MNGLCLGFDLLYPKPPGNLYLFILPRQPKSLKAKEQKHYFSKPDHLKIKI